MDKSMNRAVIGALPILARSISNRAGVRLVMNASRAQTNGTEIHLPPLPIEDPHTTALALGFIGHEAEHVRDTDMQLFEQACRIPGMGDLVNALEDIRIERGAAARLPGLKRTFKACIEAVKAKGMMISPETSSNPISDLLHLKLRVSKLDNECLRLEADAFESLVRQTMGEPFTDGLLALGEEIDHARTTRDIFNLAERILDYAKGSLPPRPATGESAGQTDGEGGDEACSSSESELDSASGEGAQGQMSESFNEMLDAALNSKGEGTFNMGRTLRRALALVSEESGDDQGVVAEEASSLGESGGAEVELEAVQASSTGLRARIERLLLAEAEAEPYSARSGRRLDRSRLWRIATGKYNVFRKEDDCPLMDTAIVTLVDRSVSMRERNRIKVAREAALTLCLALDHVEGLATSVAAFPGRSDEEVWVAKSFDQRARNCVGRFGVNPNGGTPLTQALLWAGSALLQRQEKRRIIIVNTDGEPNKPESAMATILALEAMGIEVLGLGIGISVSHLFRSSTSVADVNQLPAKMSNLLQEVLLGRSRPRVRIAS